ncbi:MAG: nucleotidyltransferase family protein [Candidatus Omnitrophica bacterium]|nr:nucleotidyltransferase family protein [Candidatus Omnitrophota bacterium]
MLSCILLAAGQSQRFGSVKALALIEEQPLIRRLQQTILSADIGELIIVLGAHSDKIEPYLLNHSQVVIVHNKDHNFGQTSSFQCGLRRLDPAANGIMLLPVDYPFLTKETLVQLSAAFATNTSNIIIPVFNGRRGHPPVFPVTMVREILDLPVTEGLNTVQHRYADCCQECPVTDPGVVATFNTPQELTALLKDL